MPLRSDWSQQNCPIARALEVLGDPWVLLVLRQSFLGVRRFEDYRAQLGVADNVLSKRLATLVEAGLLDRLPYRDARRTRAEYVLTEAGAEVLPILTALALWGDRHRPHSDPVVQMQIIHLGCGMPTSTADVCGNCGESLNPENTAWRRPWRTPVDQPLTGSASPRA